MKFHFVLRSEGAFTFDLHTENEVIC